VRAEYLDDEVGDRPRRQADHGLTDRYDRRADRPGDPGHELCDTERGGGGEQPGRGAAGGIRLYSHTGYSSLPALRIALSHVASRHLRPSPPADPAHSMIAVTFWLCWPGGRPPGTPRCRKRPAATEAGRLPIYDRGNFLENASDKLPRSWNCPGAGANPGWWRLRMKGVRMGEWPEPARRAQPEPGPGGRAADLGDLLARVARGDQVAFEAVYDGVVPAVFGMVRRVVRDPAQSEEVTQDVLLEVWRSASRFEAAKGSAMTWVMTLAHRRAVDRVRSAQASAQRESAAATAEADPQDVAEAALDRVEHERVRRCLGSLTELQREAVTLAYYGGYTYQQVAGLLGVALGTVKTRMRDGLIRLRDCMGVES
jgi:RNA polymerase sigma-70 factor (ECF subfamily)